MLDFRMETFLRVCKYMNFTKASQKLNITQPAVSQHIHYIEEFYGTKLFEYHGKKLKLTEAGERLKIAAVAMRHDDNLLKEELNSSINRKLALRFGATLTIGGFTMHDFLVSYLKEYPDINLHLTIADTKDICEKLTNSELDFALVEGYFPKSEYDYLIYSHEDFVGVCSSNFNFEGRTDSILSYLNERLIIRESGSGSREIFERYLHERNFRPDDFKSLVEINNINVIKNMVINDCGITFIYEEAVKRDIEAGFLKRIPLMDFPIKHDFYLIWQKGSIYKDYYKEIFEKFKKFR